MLYYLYEFWSQAHESGAGWAETFRFLNIFKYITFRAMTACLLAFAMSLVIGPRLIAMLKLLKAGQPIRGAELMRGLAEAHGAKAGTPTMGGVMIIGTVLIAVLLCGRILNPFLVVTMCSMIALGLLGFLDDYMKVVKKNSDGVNAKTKLLWQLVVGCLVALFLYFKKDTHSYTLVDQEMSITQLTFPLFKTALINLSWLIIPFFVILCIGSSNAVNLTDGLDGLAIGVTITVSLAYSVIAYLARHNWLATEYLFIPHNPLLGEVTIFLMALVGAGFGFLWFNCHPAKVFTGDTGSLAIGGSLGTVAICTKQEFLLVIIGGVFVMEALSVILQVGSFKLRGKRIFKMAPIHHHFELGGWHENQVIIRFWILSVFLALVGLGLIKVL